MRALDRDSPEENGQPMKRGKVSKRSFTILVITLLVAACNKPAPRGQMLAQVGDVDITRRDLAWELHVTGRYDANPGPVLDQIIDRKLLAQAAVREGIEQTPDYLNAIRRTREDILAEMYVRSLTRQLAPVTADQVARYMADRPYAYARRSLITVDRLVTAATPAARDIIGRQHDVDGFAAALAAGHIAFQRADGTVDTANIATTTAAKLMAAGPGRFVADENNGLVGYEIKSIRSAPIGGNEAQAAAGRAIKVEQLERLVSSRIEQERKGTRIRYQTGLGPAQSQ